MLKHSAHHKDLVRVIFARWLVMLLVVLSASAQQTPEQTPKTEDPFATVRGDISEKVKLLEDRIAQAEASATPERATETGVTVQELQDRALRLREMRSVLEDHLDALDVYADVQSSIEEIETELRTFTGIPEPAPYTPWFVDTFRDAVDARLAQYEIALRALDQAQQQVTKADENIKLRAGELAVATEKLAVNEDPAQRAFLEWSADSIRALHELAQARKAWAEFLVQLEQARVTLRDKERELAERRLKSAEAGERYVAEDLETLKNELAAERDELARRRVEAEAERDRTRIQLEDAREELVAAEQDENYDDARYAVAQALVERRRIEAEGAQDRAALLREQLDYIYNIEDIWGARYNLHLNPNEFPLRQQRERLTDYIASLGTARRTNETREDVLREEVRELTQRMAQMEPSLNTIDNTQATLKVRNAQLDRISETLATLSRAEKLAERTLTEIVDVEKRQSLGQRLQQVGVTAKRIWDRELFTIDESPLTVGKVGIALLIVALGLLFARFATAFLGRTLRSRPHFDPTAAAIVERLAYYGLMLLIVLFALNIVNIPLTVFTFFGGALAIGVGFGAQNLINNFISGLILMAERPIKIGDIVEVDGQIGRIVEIGARRSHLALFSGVDILVPNSSFLEKNVINWTLMDSKVRFSLSLIVQHGSSTRDVMKLLTKALTDHGKILKTPAPSVFFKDITPVGLQFELFFWLNLADGSDSNAVASDLRHMIDGAFNTAGIAFAMQPPPLERRTDRDPIEVRLVQATTEPASAEAGQEDTRANS